MTTKKIARDYLRFKLGGRRGCRVLEDLDDECKKEIIAELVEVLDTIQLDAHRQGMTDAAEIAERRVATGNNLAGMSPETTAIITEIIAARDAKTKTP